MKIKMKPITQQVFDALPEDIKAHIKGTLRVFDKMTVWYANGEYHASTGCAITRTYPADHRVIGYAYQDDFYGIDEYMDIYEQEFGSKHPGRWNKKWYEQRKAAEAGKTFIR